MIWKVKTFRHEVMSLCALRGGTPFGETAKSQLAARVEGVFERSKQRHRTTLAWSAARPSRCLRVLERLDGDRSLRGWVPVFLRECDCARWGRFDQMPASGGIPSRLCRIRERSEIRQQVSQHRYAQAVCGFGQQQQGRISVSDDDERELRFSLVSFLRLVGVLRRSYV